MRRVRYLAVTAILVLAACGETTLDGAELEQEITPELESQTGTRDVEVSCPDDIEANAGDTFDCDVTAPGGVSTKVEVTQTDDDGNVRWELVEP